MYLIYTNNEITAVSSVPTTVNSSENVRVVEVTKEEYESALFQIEQKRIKSQKIEELKQLLASTDYQAIKYAEGQISAEDYEPIKTQRQAWRDEINELEKLI